MYNVADDEVVATVEFIESEYKIYRLSNGRYKLVTPEGYHVGDRLSVKANSADELRLRKEHNSALLNKATEIEKRA